MTDTNQFTHTAWQQHYRAGKFVEWVEVGKGRIDVDSAGHPSAHIFLNRTARGDTGYTCLLPIGIVPPQPQQNPIRPASRTDAEEIY